MNINPIPIADPQERQRRYQQQFAAVEARRMADERRIRDLPPDEFAAVKAAALAGLQRASPVTRSVVAKISGDDPYKSRVLLGAMLAEMSRMQVAGGK